ncbi:Ig-like domain-containing protein, partial [Bacteroides sp.]|uniref:Ig-like domain-containing protein n=1 Tax=Bacteroides sp. TaxID=29523 RepID=UPI00258EB5C1
MKIEINLLLGTILTLLLLCTCSKGGDDTKEPALVEVTGIQLSQNSLSLKIGEKATLTATVSPSNATDKTVLWSSSQTSVATVSNAGQVTAIGNGTTVITATAGNKSAKCTVTVQEGVIAVELVSLSEEELILGEGETATLVVTILPEDATDKAVTWTSSDEAVATVSNGVVTAVKEGTATITATAGGKSAQCTVTVKKGVVAVTGITLSQTSLSLEEGKSATLTATVQPSNATDKTVSWSSSNTSVATVSNGVVTAVKEGTATI